VTRQPCDQSIYVHRRSSPNRIYLKQHITTRKCKIVAQEANEPEPEVARLMYTPVL
jgi:hypothetical protein